METYKVVYHNGSQLRSRVIQSNDIVNLVTYDISSYGINNWSIISIEKIPTEEE